jgi:hypothetical protein
MSADTNKINKYITSKTVDVTWVALNWFKELGCRLVKMAKNRFVIRVRILTTVISQMTRENEAPKFTADRHKQ